MVLLALAMIVLNAAAGGVAGALVCFHMWKKAEHRVQGYTQIDPLVVDSELSERIDEAATEWADARGIPEAASLVANRLRLGARLMERDRWSR
jgi:hypothetical protein